MSTQSRKRVLLGFGALAIVVVVALAIWAPSFRNEDASGAIGAVQKHRAPQITRQDVVLGSEAARQRQNVLYGDFLKDSAKLQSISALVAAKNYAEASGQLKGVEAEVMARYTENAKNAIAAARGARGNTTEVNSEIDAAAALAQRGQFSEADVAQFNMRMARIAELFEQQEASARGARGVKAYLADAVTEIQNRRMNDARRDLESAKQALGDQEMASRRLRTDAEYLTAIAMEMKTVNDAEVQVAQMMQGKIQAGNDTEAVNALVAQSLQLEGRAAKNMDQQFSRHTETAAFVRDAETALAAAKTQAGSRAGRTQLSRRELADVEEALAACKAQVGTMAASDLQFELLAAEEFLSHRTQVGSDEPLAAVLADLETQLAGNGTLAAVLQDEEQLAARAHNLGARARPVRSSQPSRRRAF